MLVSSFRCFSDESITTAQHLLHSRHFVLLGCQEPLNVFAPAEMSECVSLFYVMGRTEHLC